MLTTLAPPRGEEVERIRARKKSPLQFVLMQLADFAEKVELVDAGGTLASVEMMQRLFVHGWSLYEKLRALVAPTSPMRIREAMGAYWIVIMRSLLFYRLCKNAHEDNAMGIDRLTLIPDVLYANVWAHPYLEIVQQHQRRTEDYAPLVLDPDLRFSDLSVGNWLRTWLWFRRVLAVVGYSPQGHEFLRNMILQYARILNAPDELVIECDYRPYTPAVDTADGLPSLPLPTNINSQIVIRHEPEIVATWNHFEAAQRFCLPHHRRCWRWDRPSDWTATAYQALIAYVHTVAIMPAAGADLIDGVKGNILRRLVQPGDVNIYADRRKLTFTTASSVNADEILRETRRELFAMAQPWLSSKERMDEFLQSVWTPIAYTPPTRDTPSWWLRASAERQASECIALLVIETALAVDADARVLPALNLSHVAFLDNMANTREFTNPPFTPAVLCDTFRADGQTPPYFCVISRVYTVVKSPSDYMSTPYLEDAIFMWLRALIESGKMSLIDLHPKLRPLCSIA